VYVELFLHTKKQFNVRKVSKIACKENCIQCLIWELKGHKPQKNKDKGSKEETT
jgi:hypothetical protein